eukprot:COSAG04_NODE_1000_length_8841_cov_5.219973_4_plen_324_part_00
MSLHRMLCVTPGVKTEVQHSLFAWPSHPKPLWWLAFSFLPQHDTVKMLSARLQGERLALPRRRHRVPPRVPPSRAAIACRHRVPPPLPIHPAQPIRSESSSAMCSPPDGDGDRGGLLHGTLRLLAGALARAARGSLLLRPRLVEQPPRRPHAPPAAARRLRGWELGERRDGDGGGALGLLDGTAPLPGAVLAKRARSRVPYRPQLVARRRGRPHGPPAAARLRGALGGFLAGRPAGSLGGGWSGNPARAADAGERAARRGEGGVAGRPARRADRQGRGGHPRRRCAPPRPAQLPLPSLTRAGSAWRQRWRSRTASTARRCTAR